MMISVDCSTCFLFMHVMWVYHCTIEAAEMTGWGPNEQKEDTVFEGKSAI